MTSHATRPPRTLLDLVLTRTETEAVACQPSAIFVDLFPFLAGSLADKHPSPLPAAHRVYGEALCPSALWLSAGLAEDCREDCDERLRQLQLAGQRENEKEKMTL